MTLLVWVLLALAAFSIGFRTSSLFVPTRVHPIARFAAAMAVGALIAAAILEGCASYRIYDFGLGLLLSLSPVGAFDLARWWFAWRRR